MGKRRLSRQAALQFLYQADSASGEGIGAPPDISRDFMSFSSAHHGAADRETLDFALELCLGTLENRKTIDGAINRCSEHWKVSRMSRIDRNILRLSVYEMLFLSDIPLPVTINEAVEVAKEFGSENSAAFVNGVLDRLGEEIRKGEFGSDK